MCQLDVLCYEVLFCHLGKMSLNDQRSSQTTPNAKNHQVEGLVSLDGRSHGGSCLQSNPTRKLERSAIQWCGVC